VTPPQRHEGVDKKLVEKRNAVYEIARSKIPARWISREK